MARFEGLNPCPLCGAETECSTAEKGGIIRIEARAKQKQGGAKEWGDGYRAGYDRGWDNAVAEIGPKHAFWLKFGSSGSDYSDRWQCSGCKRTARADTWGLACEYERCPHCGAIMDESGGAENG